MFSQRTVPSFHALQSLAARTLAQLLVNAGESALPGKNVNGQMRLVCRMQAWEEPKSRSKAVGTQLLSFEQNACAYSSHAATSAAFFSTTPLPHDADTSDTTMIPFPIRIFKVLAPFFSPSVILHIL